MPPAARASTTAASLSGPNSGERIRASSDPVVAETALLADDAGVAGANLGLGLAGAAQLAVSTRAARTAIATRGPPLMPTAPSLRAIGDAPHCGNGSPQRRGRSDRTSGDRSAARISWLQPVGPLTRCSSCRTGV